MALFQSEDPIRCEMPNSRISLRQSDISSAKKFLENENWLKNIASYFESHYKYLGRWWELLGLQQVTIGLPPIPYGNQKIRSQFHVMLRGPPGTGKSTLIYTIKEVTINPQELGDATAAKIAGSIKDGHWVEGEAYRARDGIMLIPELSETLKSGEYYDESINHFIQIMEDQRITKSLSQPFEDLEGEIKKYPGVKFFKDGRWEYETNTCLALATWEMNESKLIEKVTAGFYSRVFEIPLNYTREQLFGLLDNIWKTISNVNEIQSDISTELIRHAFEVMYLSNKGILADLDFVEFKEVDFPPSLASDMTERYKEMIDDIYKDLKIEDEEGAVLPVLIRELLDGFRLAFVDAIARRFAGTMNEQGIVKVDERATNVAIEYLKILVHRRVETYKKLSRYIKLSAVEPELMMSDEFKLIARFREEGIPASLFYELCSKGKDYGVSQRTLQRHTKRLIEDRSIVQIRNPRNAREWLFIASRHYHPEKTSLEILLNT